MPHIPFVPNPTHWAQLSPACPAPDVLMFETEDLVLRKNEKNFVLCLLELARRAARFGMRAPTLVQMEQEIEEELRQELDLPPADTPLPRTPRKPQDLHNLDQMVSEGQAAGWGRGWRWMGKGMGMEMEMEMDGEGDGEGWGCPPQDLSQ